MKEQTVRSWVQVSGVVVVLLASIVAAVALVISRAEPPKKQTQRIGPMVEVVVAHERDVPVSVTGNGTVRAKVRAAVVPQVSGRVVQVHPNFVSGGFIRAGETIVKVDPRDYELALQRANTESARQEANVRTDEALIAEAEARVQDAELDLTRTREAHAKAVASQRELMKAELAASIARSQLANREAQLASTQAELEAAQVAVKQAKLDLERTSVSLPFDAVVVEENVDIGQYVTAGASIGRVYGNEAVELVVPLEDRELKWFTMTPLANTLTDNRTKFEDLPLAHVRGEFLGRECSWTGRVVRTEAEVDPNSRLVHVVVQVNDPMHGVEAGATPLMPGMFVTVEIQGRMLDRVIPLPRRALRNEDELWVVRDERLQVRKVQVVRRDRESIYVSGGLSDGEVVIVSPLDVVTDGMKVRIPQTPEQITQTATQKPTDGHPWALEGASKDAPQSSVPAAHP